MKQIRAFLILTVFLLSLTGNAHASDISSEQQNAANYLCEAGIMVGGTNGEMMLDQGLTRAQLAAILARMTVNPEHLEAERAFYSKQCIFNDVPEWARVFVGYCAANYLVAGYGDGRYGSNDPVTPAAACTVLLRCLEDVGTDWSYSTACRKMVELELAPAETVTEREISRGNMAILIYRTMLRMGYEADIPTAPSGGVTNQPSDGAIQLPADGNRYIPQVGDVICCDDGTDYTITDVSRYDKNMFASGPVGDLPTPTCDWDSFPKLELPAAEAQRYAKDGRDYLFIRNVYECRRMQLTLMNLAGTNPETSENGKLKYGKKGTPYVRIEFGIPEGVTPQMFWPWRESEVAKFFNSAPAGTYSIDVWDVYCNGIFQRTEYDITAL